MPVTTPLSPNEIRDRAVDAVYGKKGFNYDAEHVAFLFDLYQEYTTLLPAAEKPKRARKRRT